MSATAIRVESLGKQYRIGARRPYRTLRDTLTHAVTAPIRRIRSAFAPRDESADALETIWALDDVSFEVGQGDVIGVIGRNAAGKSTLLKILSRITEPTRGRVEIRGRVGSLLEVGTGFHPELTGRENISLNGAILGMRRADIARKFDEMVAFAEIEKFIDTPVKHYSTGMYTRLAFAVAAHLEPEILLVDEVLAVGDAQFQKKCLGKMGDVAKEGRTVLLVSHQMNQIRKLCNTCVWLENGRLRGVGPASGVISAYEHAFRAGALDDRAATGNGARTRFVSWAIDGADDDPTTLTDDHCSRFRFRVHVATPITNGHHGIALFNSDNLLVWAYAFDQLDLATGDHDMCYAFPTLPLRPGVYYWELSLYDDGGMLDRWTALPPLLVHTPSRTHASDEWQGVLNLPFSMAVRQPERAFADGAVHFHAQ